MLAGFISDKPCSLGRILAYSTYPSQGTAIGINCLIVSGILVHGLLGVSSFSIRIDTHAWVV
jgi:hypothetical protein